MTTSTHLDFVSELDLGHPDLHVVRLAPTPAGRRDRWVDAVQRRSLDAPLDAAALTVGLAAAAVIWPATRIPVPIVLCLLAWLVVHTGVLRVVAPTRHQFSPAVLPLLPALARAVGWATGLDLLVAYLWRDWAAAGLIGTAGAAGLVVVLAVRAGLQMTRSRARCRTVEGIPTVVLGTGEGVGRVCRAISAHPEAGLSLVGTLGERPSGGHPWLGGAESLGWVLRDRNVGQVLIPSTLDDEALTEALSAHAGGDVRLSWVAAHPGLMRPDGRHDRLGGLGVLHLREPRPRPVARLLREVADRVLALLLLILVSPVLLVASCAVRLDSRGGAFFRQTRIGRDGRPFRILKLRSMTADAEVRLADLIAQNQAHGPLFKLREDPRITRVGQLLRRSSLDELPQLWNVVRGEMSLIGPRPALPEEVALYPDWFRRRLQVKPGITGMWQVSGRTELPFHDAARLDLCYVDDWTPWLDLQILLRTASTVLFGRGSY